MIMEVTMEVSVGSEMGEKLYGVTKDRRRRESGRQGLGGRYLGWRRV